MRLMPTCNWSHGPHIYDSIHAKQVSNKEDEIDVTLVLVAWRLKENWTQDRRSIAFERDAASRHCVCVCAVSVCDRCGVPCLAMRSDRKTSCRDKMLFFSDGI